MTNLETRNIDDPFIRFKKGRKKKTIVLLILLFLLVFLVILSLFLGTSGLSFAECFSALFGGGKADSKLIVWNIRMPRILTAILAGGGLAIAGCIMQSTLKNPMASPSTLGISNAAVFGANFAIIALGAGVFHNTDGNSLSVSNPYLVSGSAFIFALLGTMLILLVSKARRFSPETVVLAGLAIGALFSSGATLLQYFSLDTQVAAAIYWSFGDVSRASYPQIAIIGGTVALCFLIFMLFSRSYNALALGDDVASSLGVKVPLLRFISLLMAALLSAVCVSFLGIIPFIGLLAPQIMKRIIGSDAHFLIPSSLLAGAILLLLSDTLSRLILQGASLPVGALTSLLGAPMFLYMLLSNGKGRHARA